MGADGGRPSFEVGKHPLALGTKPLAAAEDQVGKRRLRWSAGGCQPQQSTEYSDGMHYELWELLSRNLLADFDTEPEALTAVRELLAINPAEMADELALVWRDGTEGGTVAQGAALAARARDDGPGRKPLAV